MSFLRSGRFVRWVYFPAVVTWCAAPSVAPPGETLLSLLRSPARWVVDASTAAESIVSARRSTPWPASPTAVTLCGWRHRLDEEFSTLVHEENGAAYTETGGRFPVAAVRGRPVRTQLQRPFRNGSPRIARCSPTTALPRGTSSFLSPSGGSTIIWTLSRRSSITHVLSEIVTRAALPLRPRATLVWMSQGQDGLNTCRNKPPVLAMRRTTAWTVSRGRTRKKSWAVSIFVKYYTCSI